MGFNTGLIREAGSETELAGVLAHLLASVRTQAFMGSHSVVNDGNILLVFLGGWPGYAYSPEGEKPLLPVGLLQA